MKKNIVIDDKINQEPNKSPTNSKVISMRSHHIGNRKLNKSRSEDKYEADD